MNKIRVENDDEAITLLKKKKAHLAVFENERESSIEIYSPGVALHRVMNSLMFDFVPAGNGVLLMFNSPLVSTKRK